MNQYDKQFLLSRLRNTIETRQLRQQEIAEKLGVDQARVSRLLNGQFVRWGGDIKRLCELFDIELEPPKPVDASQNPILVSALNRNWDGSAEHAQLLARLIDDVCEASRYREMER